MIISLNKHMKKIGDIGMTEYTEKVFVTKSSFLAKVPGKY